MEIINMIYLKVYHMQLKKMMLLMDFKNYYKII